MPAARRPTAGQVVSRRMALRRLNPAWSRIDRERSPVRTARMPESTATRSERRQQRRRGGVQQVDQRRSDPPPSRTAAGRAVAAEQRPQQQPPEQQLLDDGREARRPRPHRGPSRRAPACWIARTTSCFGSLPATASIAATMPSATTWSSTPAASQGQSPIRTVSPKSARSAPAALGSRRRRAAAGPSGSPRSAAVIDGDVDGVAAVVTAARPRATTTNVPIRIWPTTVAGQTQTKSPSPQRIGTGRAASARPRPVPSRRRAYGRPGNTGGPARRCHDDRGGVGPGRSMVSGPPGSSSARVDRIILVIEGHYRGAPLRREHPAARPASHPSGSSPRRRYTRTGTQAVVPLGHGPRHRRDRGRALHDRGRQQRHVEGLAQLQPVHQRR